MTYVIERPAPTITRPEINRRSPAPFTFSDLLSMLRDLGALAISPVGRQILGKQLVKSIKRSKMGGALLEKAQLMYDYFRDPAEPTKPKLLIGAALLYLVIPSDLIPDWFAFIGFADDFAAIAYVWKHTKDVLLHYDERRKKRLSLMEVI